MQSDIVHRERRTYYPVVRSFIKNRMLFFLTEATGGFSFMWSRADDHHGIPHLVASVHRFKDATWDEEDGSMRQSSRR